MKDIQILHLSCKYLLGGQVTLGERAFGQILTLSDYPPLVVSWNADINQQNMQKGEKFIE